MVKLRGARWIGVVGVAACLVGAAVGVGMSMQRASAQSGDALVRVVPQKDLIKKGDNPVAIDITIENVKNEASFQFDLLYNTDIFATSAAADDPSAAFAQKGDFLGSTDRQVVCNPASNPGVVRFTCVTLGVAPAGPDGGGVLATVFLKAIGSGKTDLNLERLSAQEVGIDAKDIPLSVQNASINVTGGGGINWLLWIPIIVVAVLVVAGAVAFGAMRMRSGEGQRPATVA